MKVKQMVIHKFPTGRHSHKGNFVTKVFFLLLCLYLHIIGHIKKQTFEGEKVHSFIHFIHFKHVLKEVDRKVVKELVFSMGKDFKGKLCS